MRDLSRARRIGVTALALLIPAALMALIVPDPRTMSNIGEAFLIVVTGPLQSGWLQMRSTGPLRRSVLLCLFVALPLVLLPAYAVTPRTVTRILTIVGALLWFVSGVLMLVLRYVD